MMFLDWKCFGHALLVDTEISTSESVMICEYLWYVYGGDMQCMQRTFCAFDVCPQSLCSLAFVVFSTPFLLSSALFLVFFCSLKGRWGRWLPWWEKSSFSTLSTLSIGLFTAGGFKPHSRSANVISAWTVHTSQYTHSLKGTLLGRSPTHFSSL